ncbi:MAG: CPBP family glutamic-type intramembrane protease [Chloroflexota bacterium]
MKHSFSQYRVFLFLVLSILAIFIVRTALAARGNPPRLNDLFTAITLVGSLVVWIVGHRGLQRSDWVVAIVSGVVVGVTMAFATLFSPYPFFGIVRDNLGQVVVRGLSATVAMLGGLVIMRQGGPLQVLAATGEWRKLGRNLLLALAIGIPLALVNVFVLQMSQGQPIDWQNPLAAIRDALQPAIVEEVVYRFAFLGLLWLALRSSLPNRAAWLAALLAMLVHNYMHYDELFVQAPLVALGMGLAVLVLWGLPLTYLILRRGLEPAVAFHWIQDVARFVSGF